MMSIRVSGPIRQSPTALRLGEVLSAWLPGSEGVYSRYLQSLSPKFDHLLTYSRYDRLWRLSQHGPSDYRYSFQISLLSSPVHVIDTVKTTTDHRKYDGTNAESMEKLKTDLSNKNPNHAGGFSRIVCAQHLTCLSMEALGAGLFMDPNVFSHHIGMTFKEIEKNTSIEKLCNTKIDDIPTSVGAWERDRNLQIMKNHLGRFQFANVDHAKDLTARESLFKSIYNWQGYPMTISVDIPRTIYVQGYQMEDDRASVVRRGLRTEPWGLQDPILHRRSARQRFADDSMICDQGERYSQNGLDVLQHVTIHVANDSQNPEGQQGNYLFLDSQVQQGMY